MIEAFILASPLTEPDAQPQARGRHEIVVTGERTSRTAMETASSVVALDSQAIEDLAAPDRVDQLLQTIPNVQLGSGGEGPTIRGQDSTGVVRDLPAFLSGTRPRTTIRIDGRSATYYELAFGLQSIWDLDRIEVFRSPQTTTQGRNSIGGAIFVETTNPAFDWEGRFRFTAGDYETRQVSGVFSGPIISDELAFRLTGDLRRSRTSSEIANGAVGIDPNRDDSDLVRLKLLAVPKGLPDTSLTLTYSHGRSQMPQIEGIDQPYRERRDLNAIYGVFVIRTNALTGRFSYQPAQDFEALATVSLGKADVRRHPRPGLGDAHIKARDFSFEPVIAWRSGQGHDLTGGFNYTRSTLDQSIILTAFPRVQGSGVFSDVQNSLGVFGEATVALSAKLGLTTGLRYQQDKQVRQGLLAGNVIFLPVDYDRTFRALLPKLSLAWDVTSRLRLGALAQRASNPGGLNLNTATGQVDDFGAESLWDFELFARARLADESLTLSANLFDYEILNAQRTQSVAVPLANGQSFISDRVENAPRAWTRGLELELGWVPSQRFRLQGAIGLLDTRITRTILASDPTLGKEFQRSPHFSGSASVAWMPHDRFTISAQARHNSSYFSDDQETAVRRINGSTMIDAKASWSWRNLTISGYARNLFDEFHLTYKFLPPDLDATAGDPRELGLSLEMGF